MLIQHDHAILNGFLICTQAQQDNIKVVKQLVADSKPMVDRLNKTGSALLKLVGDENTERVQEIIDSDNNRFDTIKNSIREQTFELDQALHQTSEVCCDIF